MTSSSNASASMPSARTARVYGSGGPATGSSGHSSPQRRQTSVAGPPSNGADPEHPRPAGGAVRVAAPALERAVSDTGHRRFLLRRRALHLDSRHARKRGPGVVVTAQYRSGRMRSGMEVPELMTATQVARILGVSTETLRKWRARRMCLPYVRVGRHIRYKAADVAAFVERGTVMPDGKHGRER